MRSSRWLVLLVAVLVGCKGSPPPPVAKEVVRDAAAAPARAVTEDKGQTDVRVDRRIELLSIVQRLSGAKEYNQAKPTPYVKAVDAHFKKFEKHDAVTATTSLRNSYRIGYDAPMLLAIHLDDKLEPRPGAAEAMAARDHRWKGVDVIAYAAKLREFVTASGFDAFYQSQSAHHEAMANALRAVVDAENPVGWFDALFGKQKKARYVVVPNAISGPASFAASTTLPDGTLEMYQVLGIHTDDGMPANDPQTVELLVHEMAHSYINPVFDRHRAKLQPAGQQLFGLVAQAMRRQAYPTWEIMMNESGVRAVTTLYLKDRKGDAISANAARGEIRRGFVWTNELVEAFRKYQRDRNTYPDLEAYMPKLVELFDGIVKQYGGKLPPRPFMGPFDAVFDGELVVVEPVTEWEKLTTYVKQIHAQMLATRGPLVPASPETLAQHPNKHVLAYGTPASNAVIADLAQRASWQITTSGITLGKQHYPGATLVLVAVWFRHDDPTKGIGVYAASSDKLLPGINSLRHGDRDWMIARPDGKGNHVVVASGDWAMVNGAWVPPE